MPQISLVSVAPIGAICCFFSLLSCLVNGCAEEIDRLAADGELGYAFIRLCLGDIERPADHIENSDGRVGVCRFQEQVRFAGCSEGNQTGAGIVSVKCEQEQARQCAFNATTFRFAAERITQHRQCQPLPAGLPIGMVQGRVLGGHARLNHDAFNTVGHLQQHALHSHGRG